MRLGVYVRAFYITLNPQDLYYSPHYLSGMKPIKSDPAKRDNTRVSMPEAPSKFIPLKRPIDNSPRDPGEYRQWNPQKDPFLENVAEFFDPTGILSHDDAKYAYEDWQISGRKYPTYEEGLDMAGAVPFAGKFPKFARSGAIMMRNTPFILHLMRLLDKAADTEGLSEDVKEDQLGL